MIIYDGSELYPLRENKIYLGDELYHDRSNRKGKSWFILDLALFTDRFIPKNSNSLITSEGQLFGNVSKKRGPNWYENN